MQIAGFQKLSFVDYPHKMSFVIFVKGCNMNCWYCHNSHILTKQAEVLDETTVFKLIQTRVGFNDAVVFSGGEPTLYPDLPDKIKMVKDMGFLIKLDTNGLNPKMLEKLILDGNIDYIAMDIKAPIGKYKMATCVDSNVALISKSIELIKNSGIDYEFRTTFIPQFNLEDAVNMAKMIEGAERYYLQQYVPHENDYGDVVSFRAVPHKKQMFIDAKAECEKYVKQVLIRGIDLDA